MSGPNDKKTYPSGKDGTDGDALENVIRRTDTIYGGDKPGEDLIGTDIPEDEQDAEEEENY